MDKKWLIAGGAGVVGLVAIRVIRSRSAASQSSDSSGTTGTSDAYASYLPVTTGVSTSGAYAVDTGAAASSGSDSVDTTGSTNSTVSNFASLLQGILTSGSQFAAQAQSNAAANNDQASQMIANAAPAAAAVTAAPAAASTPAYTGDKSLYYTQNGYLVDNPGLYASDSAYRAAWDSVASANNARFGANWNSVSKGADGGMLNNEIVAYYQQHYGN